MLMSFTQNDTENELSYERRASVILISVKT